MSDTETAARLVGYGMRPKALPGRDPDYADLVRRYREDDEFRTTVQRVASGLGLVVLAVDTGPGIVLAATEGSVFEIRMDEYARRTALANRGADKVLHGIAHLAVAALAFPRPDDLGDDSYVGRVSVELVDGAVREACRVLNERAAGPADPESDAPQLEEVWRVWQRRPEATATKDGRVGESTTRGIVGKALRFLADQGFLVPVGAEGAYRTTPRYQVQVRELAAQRAFDELLALNVLPAATAAGTLVTEHDGVFDPPGAGAEGTAGPSGPAESAEPSPAARGGGPAGAFDGAGGPERAGGAERAGVLDGAGDPDGFDGTGVPQEFAYRVSEFGREGAGGDGVVADGAPGGADAGGAGAELAYPVSDSAQEGVPVGDTDAGPTAHAGATDEPGPTDRADPPATDEPTEERDV
ncbi:hypothetical protein Ae717Ps2_4792c [Pseudonocardia sp. Ae717_Ps2]|nr:hypothetical protein Ae717Ps2_4792c [Pseudonocardia sp. Ae717_Ps2]